MENPQTFNEKLQWLKLYNREEIYTTMVDKYEVKNYVANIIGNDYIIPTIGVYDSFNEINFKELPNQFVIKCTHDSGGCIIIKNKNELDLKKIKKTVNKFLNRKYFYIHREWPYKNVKPRIIIEQFMEDSNDMELRDYKFFCFDGKVKALFIATDRNNHSSETCFDFFDADFNHLDITNGHPNAKVMPHKPNQFEKMKQLAEKLSKDIPHVRVDFYEVNNHIYFGEMTFFHWSGYVEFSPEKWDLIFGNMIKLPRNNK